MKDKTITTISVFKPTARRFKMLGKRGQHADEILNILLDIHDLDNKTQIPKKEN